MFVIGFQNARSPCSAMLSRVLSRVPWWLDEAPPDPEAPPLAGDAEADVAIVGGGYTGLWTALELKRRDPGPARDRARGRARRLRAERPERRLPRDVLVRAAARCARGSATKRRSSSPARPKARSGCRGARRGRLAAPRRDARGLDDARAGRGRRRRDSRRGRARRPRAGRRRSSPGDLAGLPARVRFPDAATVQPARLVRALRRAALGAGVVLHERSRVDLDPPRRGRDAARPRCALPRSSSPRTRG